MNTFKEQAFSDFLDSLEGDRVFGDLQDVLRAVFLEGYRNGEKNAPVQVIYIIHKKRTEE